jgi:aryl-alcohol dehydrogenase-like predicted oxidoreductase
VALAWVLHQKWVSTVIIGAKDPSQLADNLGASEVSLSPEAIKRLDAASALPAEYPAWMIERQGAERMVK